MAWSTQLSSVKYLEKSYFLRDLYQKIPIFSRFAESIQFSARCVGSPPPQSVLVWQESLNYELSHKDMKRGTLQKRKNKGFCAPTRKLFHNFFSSLSLSAPLLATKGQVIMWHWMKNNRSPKRNYKWLPLHQKKKRLVIIPSFLWLGLPPLEARSEQNGHAKVQVWEAEPFDTKGGCFCCKKISYYY